MAFILPELCVFNDHCSGIDKDTFLQYYNDTTKEPFNFFMIDKKTKNKNPCV
jgi:hypothetical protein